MIWGAEEIERKNFEDAIPQEKISKAILPLIIYLVNCSVMNLSMHNIISNDD